MNRGVGIKEFLIKKFFKIIKGSFDLFVFGFFRVRVWVGRLFDVCFDCE